MMPPTSAVNSRGIIEAGEKVPPVEPAGETSAVNSRGIIEAMKDRARVPS